MKLLALVIDQSPINTQFEPTTSEAASPTVSLTENNCMKILLTNDDGIHADGLIQLASFLKDQGNSVFVVAPATEQSGVSSAITYLSPLFTKPFSTHPSSGTEVAGAAVSGTPVDCVRLGLNELCPWRPDLVLSGINDGLNAGANVNYSGTVAGAMTGASLGFKAMAISVESGPKQEYRRAAESAWPLMEKLVATDFPKNTFLNVNYPTKAIESEPDFNYHVIPAETNPMGYRYAHGNDPKNRPYYWATNNPPPEPSPFLTDTQVLRQGKVTATVLSSDINYHNSELLPDWLSGVSANDPT